MSQEQIQPGAPKPLSRGEKAVLAVLVSPAYYLASTSEKAKAAGVSVQRFYQIVKDPLFKEIQRNLMHDLVSMQVSQVLQSAIQCATQDGSRGHQDRRMILEMAGMITPQNSQPAVSNKPVKAFADIDDGDDQAPRKELPNA